ncbi:MAG TPA: class I SAM-dependent methyltransferase [Acidimicrobiales bacterium]|nr:class I SAM-dependent methyltransferase [Acidimicrobiales bacterium]
MPERTWDAASYHKVSGPMEAMGLEVLERLPLAGRETVVDAGCGTGRVTEALAERLPGGRVFAVDADPAMVAAATANLAALGDRVLVVEGDLLDLPAVLTRAAPGTAGVDAILSTATFHWILDHDRLFASLFAALRPGGRLVAQCGGAGNLAAVLAAADAVAAGDPRWAPRFEGWTRPSRMAAAEETGERMAAAGFESIRAWLEPNPVVPDDPLEYLRTINLGAHVQRLPEGDRDEFVERVATRLGSPVTIDYVRLNLDGTRPAVS